MALPTEAQSINQSISITKSSACCDCCIVKLHAETCVTGDISQSKKTIGQYHNIINDQVTWTPDSN